MACKCQFPDGVEVRPDGINKLDPCLYKRMEEHRNVTVYIDQCVRCGHIEIGWEANENTESIIYEERASNEDNGEDTILQHIIEEDEE